MDNSNITILRPRRLQIMSMAAVISVLLLALSVTTRAELTFEKARNTEGVSNNSILNLLQDKRGYIWMGSYDGLNRYDGKRVDVFRFEIDNKEGLSGNVIGELLPADGDFIWVLTSMGLDRFSTKSLKATAHFPQIRSERHLMAADSTGNAFAFSPDGTLLYFDRSAMEFVKAPVKNLPGYKNVKRLLLDGTDTLLIICKDGKAKKIGYDFSAGQSPGKAGFTSSDIDMLHNGIVTAIPGKKGVYCVDIDGRLYFIDYSTYSPRLIADISTLPYSRISGITPFGNDLIIGFFGVGAGILKRSEGNRFEMFSSETGVFEIISDRRQPLVWCATDGRGLFKIYDANTRFHAINSSHIPGMSKPIRCFNTDDRGNLLIGTKGDGLIEVKDYKRYYNSSAIPDEAIVSYGLSDGLPDNQIFAITDSRYHPGRKWIASRGPGISYIKMPEGKITNIPHPAILDIHDIYEQNDSVIWLASTTRGLIRAVVSEANGTQRIAPGNVSSFEFKLDPYICNEIHSMAFDGDSTLYVGCRGGLGVVKFNVFNYKYDFISEITDKFPAIGDVISLYYSKDGKLYFGSSAGAGILDCKTPGAGPRILTRNDGMTNDMAHSILRDKNGQVWISTNKGLVRFDPFNNLIHNSTDFEGSVSEFCDNAGYISPVDGNIFFGAINGIVSISSDEIKDSPSAGNAPFYFNAIQVNGLDRNLDDMLDKDGCLVLASDENTIKVYFAALDYINGDDFNYYYRLEGYDDEWSNLATRNDVSFTNLTPGDYTLQVMYKSDKDNNPETIYSLPVSVLPPWYRSTPAMIVYALLLMGVIVASVMLARRYVANKRHEFEMTLYNRQQEQLNSDRMEFFQNITHELCTPLTMIMALCNRLRHSTDTRHNENLEKYLDSLQQHSSNLNELIQEILDIREMQEPDFRIIRVQPVSIENILTKWVLPFREIAAANGIRFEVEADNPDLRWNTDASTIGKIATNLISNALKYTPEKGTVKVDFISQEDSLRFSVYNTGEGISPEVRESLFDKYTMFRNADRNGYSDMASRHGLGLYICKSLVEKLNGTISVESTPGEFTRFVVVLPHLEISDKEKTAPAIDAAATPFSDSGNRQSILAVDDNPDILWIISEVLSDKYDVMTAASAAEAFEKISRRIPSLIITDLMMPDTDGLAFISEIRKKRFTKNVPILILSAKITEKHKIEGYASGADEYMTKPFSPQFLRVVVERMLNRKREDKEYYHSSESAVTMQHGMEITNEDKEFFDRLRQYIIDNLEDENKLKPSSLAEAMGVEVRTLYRKFKKSTPFTPTEFVKNYRYAYAANLLRTTNITIQEIIYKVGLSNKTMFFSDFKKFYGMTPKEYRDAAGGKGQ